MINRAKVFYYHMSKQKFLLILSSYLFSVMCIEGMWGESKLIFICIFAILILLHYKNIIRFELLIFVLIGVFLGIFRYGHFIYFNYYKYIDLVDKETELNGFLVEEPTDLSSGKIRFVFKDINIGRVLVYTDKYLSFRQGEKLKIRGVLEEAPEFLDFSYKKYLQTESIFFVVSKVNLIERDGFEDGFIGNLFNYKVGRLEFVKKYLQYPYSILASGMIFGEKGSFSEDFKNILMINGVMHITAVSGFNINILFNYLYYFSRFVNRKVINLGSLLLLFFFIVLVGTYNYSALRAVIFSGILSLGKFWGKRVGSITLLSVTVLIMMFFNPFVYRSAGFLFSLAAILSIFYLNGFIKKIFKVNEIFSTAISVSFFTGLLQIYMFKNFSLVGILINILIAPLVSLVTLLGVLVVFLSSFNEIMAGFISLYLTFMLNLMVLIFLAGAKFKVFYIQNIELNFILFAGLIILSVYFMLSNYFFYIRGKLSKV